MVYDPDEILEELEDELLGEEYDEEEYDEEDFDEEEYDKAEDEEEEEEVPPRRRRRKKPDIDWDERNYDPPDAVFQADPRAGNGRKLLVVLLDILFVWLLLRWCLG